MVFFFKNTPDCRFVHFWSFSCFSERFILVFQPKDDLHLHQHHLILRLPVKIYKMQIQPLESTVCLFDLTLNKKGTSLIWPQNSCVSQLFNYFLMYLSSLWSMYNLYIKLAVILKQFCFIKPPELKLKVCTPITDWLFELKSTVVMYRGKTNVSLSVYHIIPLLI